MRNRSHRGLVAFGSVLALALSAQPAFAGPAAIGVTHGTAKILPTDPVPAATSAIITAARNEFEPFQIVVGGGGAGVTALTASASALLGPGGASIPASQIRLYREAYITTTTPSYMASPAGRWPDALVPDVDELYGEKRNAFPIDVPANENRVIWVDVYVPLGTPAGAFTGTITLSGGGLAATTVPVSLTVYGFDLPSTASLGTTFGMGWDAACIQEVGGYAACGDAGVIASHLRYSIFFLNRRVTVDSVYTGPNPNANGYDWATWDAIYSPIFDGTTPAAIGPKAQTATTILPGAHQTSIVYTWNGDTAHHAEWATHFHTKGWFPLTFDYTCDEPPNGCNWSDIPTRAAAVHAADPAFPVLVTTTIDNAMTNNVLDSIDILSPIINEVFDKGKSDTRPSYDSWLAMPNKQLYMYQSCESEGCYPTPAAKMYDPYYTGWPSYMIDAPANLNRAMEWESYVERIQKELYYETTYAFEQAGNDPWANQWYFGGNGDGTLVYPGTAAKIGGTDPVPVASIRLDLIREGMEDYEYLKMLTDLGGGAEAMMIARTVVPNGSTVVSGDAILAARATLAADILAIIAKPTPDGGSPTTGAGGGAAVGAGGANAAVSGSSVSAGGAAQTASGPAAESDSGGCGCHTSSAPGGFGLWLSAGLALAALTRRRKR